MEEPFDRPTHGADLLVDNSRKGSKPNEVLTQAQINDLRHHRAVRHSNTDSLARMVQEMHSIAILDPARKLIGFGYHPFDFASRCTAS
jgi:hypothetical protein